MSNGKIVVAGSTGQNFAATRFNANGTLDTTLNGTGTVTTTIGIGENNAASGVVQGDGKIVVAGQTQNGDNYDFGLVRFNANGSLDTTFNGTGKVTTPVGSLSF